MAAEAGFLISDCHDDSAHDPGDPPGIRFERAARKICTEQGGLIYLISAFDQKSLSRTMVKGSMSLALRIGRAIESPRDENRDPISAIIDVADGKRFITARSPMSRGTSARATIGGRSALDRVEEDRGRHAFKNEYLILKLDGEVMLTVTDLIILAETETGTPVSTDIVRPGLRLTVLGLPASPLLRTPVALKVGWFTSVRVRFPLYSIGPGAGSQ
jgi:DUF917 family protein